VGVPVFCISEEYFRNVLTLSVLLECFFRLLRFTESAGIKKKAGLTCLYFSYLRTILSSAMFFLVASINKL
jgi:hypothetical protein